ncbi:M15 family metallopeptidase [Allocoleopsis franciscana]|uniref:D-alanyl-D-alanine carboxypeptidase n=1 Tax=Allocoleopsis franciscana PCC 7113 TaxID=1173027 RepID=K9WAA5_9CYAN|nr:M15 family metallopeptidase [Allocoleopsis franciscana]AFZ16694.1 D-alanyl-D-alanine carboxypeptidase [Allocoleopsis franciscana PCC 7113]
MNNGDLPGKTGNFSVSPDDDIPEALRDTPDIKRQSRIKPVWVIVGLLGLGAIATIISLSISSSKPKPIETSTSAGSQTESSPETEKVDNLLGHLPYQEAPASELKPITANGQIKLRAAAAEKFKAMSAAAAREGISLVPISGFRAVADQKHLFFDVKAQRGQVTTKRAEVSAPPGYSEHHTGYAVDIGDGKTPATNLSPTFENTSAFKWLKKNAAYYSFEISFPKGNAQGVNYEPWHWRFVGDTDSLKTFYRAKNLIRPASPSSTEPSATPTSPELTEPSATPTSTSPTEPSATPTSPSATTPSATP